MSYVVIIKTAKDAPLWSGLPDNYPVLCQEFDTLDEAQTAFPDKIIMAAEDYKKFAGGLQSAFPAPEPAAASWWKFWRRA